MCSAVCSGKLRDYKLCLHVSINVWENSDCYSNVLTRNSSVDETCERYRLNHAIVVQAAWQAVVCGTICLQAACLHSWRRSAVYSTFANTTLDLLSVGNICTACLWTTNFASHSRSFKIIRNYTNNNNNNNESISTAQNKKKSSDAPAGIKSFQFLCKCLNRARRSSNVSW